MSEMPSNPFIQSLTFEEKISIESNFNAGADIQLALEALSQLGDKLSN